MPGGGGGGPGGFFLASGFPSAAGASGSGGLPCAATSTKAGAGETASFLAPAGDRFHVPVFLALSAAGTCLGL